MEIIKKYIYLSWMDLKQICTFKFILASTVIGILIIVIPGSTMMNKDNTFYSLYINNSVSEFFRGYLQLLMVFYGIVFSAYLSLNYSQLIYSIHDTMLLTGRVTRKELINTRVCSTFIIIFFVMGIHWLEVMGFVLYKELPVSAISLIRYCIYIGIDMCIITNMSIFVYIISKNRLISFVPIVALGLITLASANNVSFGIFSLLFTFSSENYYSNDYSSFMNINSSWVIQLILIGIFWLLSICMYERGDIYKEKNLL